MQRLSLIKSLVAAVKTNFFHFLSSIFYFYSAIVLSKQYSHFCFCLNQAWCTSHVHLIQSTRNISFLKFAFMIYWAFLVAIYDQREGTHHDRLHKYHASWLIVFLELKYYTNIWYFQTYAKKDMIFAAKKHGTNRFM